MQAHSHKPAIFDTQKLCFDIHDTVQHTDDAQHLIIFTEKNHVVAMGTGTNALTKLRA